MNEWLMELHILLGFLCFPYLHLFAYEYIIHQTA